MTTDHDAGYDPVVFDVLLVNCDELAEQITLADLRVFKRISVSELLSCAWTKKSKLEEAPNIVAFTQRFNSTSYLTCREILSGQSSERRAQLVSYFIKLAKRLYQLNNLHSTWAVISALTTQPIFRLDQTWERVTKSHRQQMQRFADLFSSRDNFSALRAYMHTTGMPCVPHLGPYLTDLIFMHDMLAKTGAEATQPPIQENIDKLLRALTSFQDSCYEIPHRPHIAAFLASAARLPPRAATERLFYELSLRLEPPSPTTTTKTNGSEADASARRSSLPIAAIKHLTTSTAGKYSPNSVVDSPRRRKKSLSRVASEALASPRHHVAATLCRIRRNPSDAASVGIDNAAFFAPPPPTTTTSPTRHERSQSLWYDESNAGAKRLDAPNADASGDDDEDEAKFNVSPNSTRLFDLVQRLGLVDAYDTSVEWMSRRSMSPRLKSFASAAASKSANSTPTFRRRKVGGGKSPARNAPGSPVESRSLLMGGGDEEGLEMAGVFTRTQIRGKQSRAKLIRSHQTCYLELRGRNLVEYERKLVPLYAPSDRDIFQQRPKRVINLAEGGWALITSPMDAPSRNEPGFQLHQQSSGRVFRYACRSWATASHWTRLIREALASADPLPTEPNRVEEAAVRPCRVGASTFVGVSVEATRL